MVSDHLRAPDFRPWPTGMPLGTAFASSRLARVNAFHRSPGNSVPLEHPCGQRLVPEACYRRVQPSLLWCAKPFMPKDMPWARWF